MAPRLVYRLGWAFHRLLFRATGGRVGTERAGAGLGTLFLATRGRRSGKERRTALFYIEDGRTFVVVASNAGADYDPAWWRNLQANPDAIVEVGGDRVPVGARNATPDETAGLWPRLEAAHPPYETYRAAATRHIPVVLLEPRVDGPR